MAQFITLTGRGKIGGLRVNLDRLVAYFAFEFTFNKQPHRGSKLDFGDGVEHYELYEVFESPEEIDRLINPTGTR
jgi:hypothetical protein